MDFVKTQLYPKLKAASTYGENPGNGPDRLGVTFGGDVITELEIVEALWRDVSLAGIGFSIVSVYMWAHLDGSVFLAACGMAEIIVSFPTAYAFHRVVMGLEYVSILQFLAIFVILGIGVDDVFVFYDTYAQATRAVGRDGDLTARLSYAYEHAGRAMFVTSFTSAAAFCSNLASAIPAVRVFGVFLAVMVGANYVLVVTWFPACIACWEMYFRPAQHRPSTPVRSPRERVGLRRRLSNLVNDCTPLEWTNNAFKRRFPRVYRTCTFKNYARHVLRARRRWFIAIGIGLGVGGLVIASGLPGSNEVSYLLCSVRAIRMTSCFVLSLTGPEDVPRRPQRPTVPRLDPDQVRGRIPRMRVVQRLRATRVGRDQADRRPDAVAAAEATDCAVYKRRDPNAGLRRHDALRRKRRRGLEPR